MWEGGTKKEKIELKDYSYYLFYQTGRNTEESRNTQVVLSIEQTK